MIITYHEIVTSPCPYLYAVELQRMQEHIELLLRRDGHGHPDVPVMFDDGLACQQRPGAEVLERAGLRGTFFVTPKRVGQRGYLCASELRELAAAGHDIQSHGWSHQLLPLCNPEQLRDELIRSRHTLEDLLGRQIDAIAVPGGAYSTKVLLAAAKTGYVRVYTSDPWQKPAVRHGVVVAGRFMVRNSTTAAKLQSLLETEHRPISLPRLANLARKGARAALGVSLYHGLWNLAARAHYQPNGYRE